MERRKLGKLEVSAVGLGCMSMTPIYADPDPAEAIATIHRAPELGIDLIDTSDAYGNGKNEELVSKALAGRRDKYILATKFGNLRLPDGKPGVNGRPEYVAQAFEASVRRLGVDVVDLYYQHRVDPDVPIEETVGAMAKLIEQGKVRYLGLSEASDTTIRRAHKTHPITAVQSEYSLWTRDLETDVLKTCEELGIGFVGYAPLGRGFLTGTIDGDASLHANDRRRDMPRFQGDNMQHNLKLVAELKAVAADEKRSPAQVAIAWVLARRPPVVALAGTSRRRWLEENAKAAEIKLSPAAVKKLEEVFKPGVTQGTRYPAAQMARVGV